MENTNDIKAVALPAGKVTAAKLNSIWEALESADPSKCLPVGHEGCSTECESTSIHYMTLAPVEG